MIDRCKFTKKINSLELMCYLCKANYIKELVYNIFDICPIHLQFEKSQWDWKVLVK